MEEQKAQDVEILECELQNATEKRASGKDRVLLIPRPSDDPSDPLNWPMRKKAPIVVALCLASFAGFSGALSGQLIPAPQAKLYGVTISQMAYQNSFSQTGMATGGFFFFPLAHKIGRSSAIFWSLIGLVGSLIWCARMTSPNDFWNFLGARFLSGFCGAVVGGLGPRVLIDLFFLHQRGRAFTLFHFFFDFGTVAGPTLCAFVAAGREWSDAYWWACALAGFAAIVSLIFLHETGWDRTGVSGFRVPTGGFWSNRVATFLPGTKVVPHASLKEILKVAQQPLILAIAPVSLLLNLFALINFGFYVALHALIPVWLQKPETAGGYGFTSKQNAYFSTAGWLGVTLAWAYGTLISDYLPLAICARRGGIWKPEYRLHALWIPALIFNPIGLGIFGAALKHHWHWAVLAVANVFVSFGSLAITPITVNYLCEIFTRNPAEAAIVLNFFRLAFGLSIAFYINPWVGLMGFNWAYGMMACLQVFSFFFVVLLMWKGHEIRQWQFGDLMHSEEGEHILEKQDKSN